MPPGTPLAPAYQDLDEAVYSIPSRCRRIIETLGTLIANFRRERPIDPHPDETGKRMSGCQPTGLQAQKHQVMRKIVQGPNIMRPCKETRYQCQ